MNTYISTIGSFILPVNDFVSFAKGSCFLWCIFFHSRLIAHDFFEALIHKHKLRKYVFLFANHKNTVAWIKNIF